jgi:two-component system sensor histidine kinase RegB
MSCVTSTAPSAEDVRLRINLSWLIRLRWGAVLGQSVAVGAAYALLHMALPLWHLLAVLALTAASNLAVALWARRGDPQVPEHLLGLLVTLDLLLLTALLYFAGGSTNPFNFLYLVHIALAAVILRARWMAALVVLSFACFVALFFWYVPLPVPGHAELPTHLYNQGSAMAFALAAMFIVYFVHRVTQALARKEGELAQAREESARSERLTSLATLAAGAAHELATPLATIAIVSKELERHLGGTAEIRGERLGALREDAQLIRHQVERCRSVLRHMAADAGASQGEPLAHIAAPELVAQALAELPSQGRVVVGYGPGGEAARVHVPERSVAQGVRAVVKNALEASAGSVEVETAARDGACVIAVRDSGPGMPPEVLRHVSEPFFTTKAPGEGMGLGLFLTRTVFERLGGALEVQSGAGRGTTVVLRLPLVLQAPEESHHE